MTFPRSHSPHEQQARRHRRPCRTLERPAQEDGHPRMARLRDRRAGGRHHGRHQGADRRATPTTASPAPRPSWSRTPASARPPARWCSCRARSLTVKDGEFRAAVKDVEQAVSGQSVVTNVVSPYAKGGTVSEDGHSALVQFDIKGDSEHGRGQDRPRDGGGRQGRGRALATSRSAQFGGASVNKELAESQKAEQSRSQMISLSVTLLILLITFGALLAAAVPVVLSPDRRHGHDGPRRARQPARPDRQRHDAGRPARRPRRRRRLLAVLHPARA